MTNFNPIASFVQGLAGPVVELIDDLHTSEEEKMEMKKQLLTQQGQQKLAEMQQKLSAILAEAQSADPWTSRARPSFFYVMYIYILSAIPFSIWSVYQPDHALMAIDGMKAYLEAIPGELYALFGSGFLGYGAFRSWEKVRGATK